MDIATDVERIAEQERRLRFAKFDPDTAWQLGIRTREIALGHGVPLVIEVRIACETVFFCAINGTAPTNADWARRKRNTVELMHRSSYGIGRSLEQKGQTLLETMGLPLRDYASSGGSFPLRVKGVGCIGALTVSGAPQRVDHDIVVTALAELCKQALTEVALDPS